MLLLNNAPSGDRKMSQQPQTRDQKLFLAVYITHICVRNFDSSSKVRQKLYIFIDFRENFDVFPSFLPFIIFFQ